MTRMPDPPLRLAYLCLQATREGQASHAHVHEIIAGLRKRGWEVELVEPRYAAPGSIAPGALGRLVEFARVEMAYLAAARKADLLYVRSHFAALPIALWARLSRRSVVQEVNGVYEDAYVAWPVLARVRRLVSASQRAQLRWAKLVITVTDGLGAWIRADAEVGRVAIVPNGANTKLFTPDGPTFPGLPVRYVGFVGALAGWQGLDTMLQATQDPAWPAGVPLVIVGAGAGAAAVREAAQGNPLLIYLGERPYATVPAIIRGAAAMLSVKGSAKPSLSRGVNPLKVYEALACGVPVIVSDYPGQADLVRAERCGWVVPTEDPGAVAHAVAEAVTHPGDRDARGERGRMAVAREHSWDQRAAATDALLRRLMRTALR